MNTHLSVYYMLGIEGGCESKKESDRELRGKDMAIRNHNTKKKVMDANREGLKNVKSSYPRDI